MSVTRPRTRPGTTQKFSIGSEGLEGYLTINVNDDGRPFEVFLTCSRQGTIVRGMFDTVALLVSHSLQRNLDNLPDICDALVGVKFEPYGLTQDEDVPECTSIADYVGQKLSKYLKDQE